MPLRALRPRVGSQADHHGVAQGVSQVQEPVLERSQTGTDQIRSVIRYGSACSHLPDVMTMNASVSKTALNNFLYDVCVVGGTTAPTPTGSECSQFDCPAAPRRPSARRRRIVALRRWMTRTCGRAKKDARHGALGLLHPDATHRDRGERPPADHRHMMAGYCNAALRRRRRWEPLPPPPTHWKASSTDDFRRPVATKPPACTTSRTNASQRTRPTWTQG